MKKNLISILILALLIVNVVLTTIMMININSTAKRTSDLVANISSILNLELTSGVNDEADEGAAVAIENVEVYDVPESMTIPLKRGEDGVDHYAVLTIALSMDKKAEGYKDYGADMLSKDSLIRSEINEVVSNHTIDEMRVDTDAVRKEILDRLQTMFGSEFIYKVAFREMLFQ